MYILKQPQESGMITKEQVDAKVNELLQDKEYMKEWIETIKENTQSSSTDEAMKGILTTIRDVANEQLEFEQES